ncbi:two-component system response regulator CreB [Marinobacterium lutimaris]|uniref:Two component transcriptional regulator, winged helix family n=1 Tax=Marinobacterium lutimaris TaxID=568106 RepID=A0A1H6AUR7_9GAMM|nr:two-component system response regulator CreB [Marinobacterium lutimaris]SEG52044.1 two component transcriptional regulator, winged helix family [Marinobacterium lutimaris]
MSMEVLIVEDEPAIAETVVYALESEGISCEWVSTGNACLTKIAEQPVQLLLLDIGLPDRSGFDLCREISASHPLLPIIFLTSRHSEIDQVLGLELGADDYITKPFSPRVLSARVRSKLRRLQPAFQPTIQPTTASSIQSGFHDDGDALRISLDGQLLDLSRYEYRLLSLLLDHPGRIYSRDQLMELVWEDPGSSFDRTVDTHIKTLRQKIREVQPELDPIKTHRGLGYSYEG